MVLQLYRKVGKRAILYIGILSNIMNIGTHNIVLDQK